MLPLTASLMWPRPCNVVQQAEIVVENAEELYREIRVENTLVNEKGEEVGLKPGAPVEVTIEANEKDTIKKEKSTGA